MNNLEWIRKPWYWVRDGIFLAGMYPGDADTERERFQLNALLDAGIGTVVDLLEPGECRRLGLPATSYHLHLKELAAERNLPITVHSMGFQDMSIPSPDLMRDILDTIDGSITSGIPVYVHCLAGVGRTGTVVGCWLARHGIASGNEVLKEINKLREYRSSIDLKSPQTFDQCNMVREWGRGH